MTEPDRTHRCPGFTLFEIVLVIALLGLLATLLVPSSTCASDNPKVEKAKTDVRTITDAARLFRNQNRRAPTLTELYAQGPKGRPWLDDSVNKDPWDHEYLIHALDRGEFEVVSSGPDGVENTEDDISCGDQRGR